MAARFEVVQMAFGYSGGVSNFLQRQSSGFTFCF
jgi:hypothetical protein